MTNRLKTEWVFVTGVVTAGVVAAFVAATQTPTSGQERFQIEEATISGLHAAIRAGQTTCRAIVQAYVERGATYNGVANQLVTESGAPVPASPGVVRAGSPIKFPTATIKASTVLPDLDQYRGTPIEFGRMQATASDPAVNQQYGMTVGIPNAGQLNAIGTFNLRGERSVTCKGDFDKAPSAGALPQGAPAVCEEFRKQPDALERAAELDAKYGREPDLAAMPMYCVPFSFKDPFDTKDMRSTGGADARYDIDVPARDHVLVEQLRNKGAIIYAKSVLTEYNGRAGDPGGRHSPTSVLPSTLGYQRSTWGGNPVNVYDTTRAASLGSSSGSAVSVSANLTMCGLCEETRASCRGPANHNSVALILPHKALIGFDGGAIGSDIYADRTGIHCRNITDAAKVLDALKDPVAGYYDPRDVFTTVPRSSVLSHPYGHRCHVRHSRLPQGHAHRHHPRVDAHGSWTGRNDHRADHHGCGERDHSVLRDHLGATLVESVHPLWAGDAAIEDMTTTYTQALTKLVPVFFPDILYRLTADGKPLFPEFAAAIKPTEFATGKTLGSGTMTPIDYMVGLAEGRIPPPANLDIRTIQQQAASNAFRFHFVQYATRRAAEWEKRGFKESLIDFPTLNARSTFWGDDQRAAFRNWEETDDMRNPIGTRQGIDERILLRELLRRVDMMVMLENKLDLVVRLHSPLPPGKIGLAPVQGTTGNESTFGPNAGETEVLIPAGYVQTVYDASFVLSPDKTRYAAVNNKTMTPVPAPGMPFSLVFRAEPGREDVILKVASAYEAASKRRVSPPGFGPVVARVSQAAQ